MSTQTVSITYHDHCLPLIPRSSVPIGPIPTCQRRGESLRDVCRCFKSGWVPRPMWSDFMGTSNVKCPKRMTCKIRKSKSDVREVWLLWFLPMFMSSIHPVDMTTSHNFAAFLRLSRWFAPSQGTVTFASPARPGQSQGKLSEAEWHDKRGCLLLAIMWRTSRFEMALYFLWKITLYILACACLSLSLSLSRSLYVYRMIRLGFWRTA